MDPLPTATSLARALLALARARGRGVLSVGAGRRSARLAVVDGEPRAIALAPSDDETLGDALARAGELDYGAHGRALAGGAPTGPVGDWLVHNGAATRSAVERALRAQLRRRVGHLFLWRGAELGFRAGAADVGQAHVSEPVPPADLVLGAMRDVVAEQPVVVARRRLGDGLVVLTRLGRALVEDAALAPEEEAMVPLLDRGSPVDVVLAAAGGTPRAIRSLYALRVLSAVAPPAANATAYSVLLRKHRQLRGAVRADDRSLLDLPPGARPKEARRALRRLAHVVHPDRFAESEAPAIRAASREVMSALVQAEARLSTGGGR